MMRVLFLFLIVGYSLHGQNVKNDSLETYLQVSVSAEELRNERLQQLADSLINFSGGKFPEFLLDECLDWRKGFWAGFHSPISVRWEILKRVDNVEALKKLLERGDERLKKRCILIQEEDYPYLKVPDMEKSFYQLIKRRCKELEDD